MKKYRHLYAREKLFFGLFSIFRSSGEHDLRVMNDDTSQHPCAKLLFTNIFQQPQNPNC